MRLYILFFIVINLVIINFGCISASRHAAEVQQGLQGDKLTVGTVQREIKKGMSGGEVISILGSPNIVSTDEKGREVWVYDRISTDRVYSTSSGGLSIGAGGILTGAASGGVGLGSVGSSSGAGAVSTSQKTLTIILKFNENKKVREIAYHVSRF